VCIGNNLFAVTTDAGLRQEDAAVNREPRPPSKPPMCDAEFRTFLDAVGCVVYPQQFRLAVYQAGVEPSLRKVVWRHLLNIYPGSLNGRERFDYLRRKSNEYFRLRDEWQARQSDDAVRVVAGMVRKDVLRTDRQHPFYAGENNANGTLLFNLLVTFAVTHPKLSYWQGMSDIASPILAVEVDEATAYVCFCALMRRMAASFAADGVVMTARFQHLISLLRHFDRALYTHVCRCGADDMFFTYRWLLLEMKREFPLDDAMYALEVMWSSLPITPPDDDLPLFDPAYRESVIPSSAPVSHAEAYVHLRSYQRRISSSHSHAAVCDSSQIRKMSVNGAQSDFIPDADVASNSEEGDSVHQPADESGDGIPLMKRGQSGSPQAVRLHRRVSDNNAEDPDEQTSLLITGDGASIGFVKASNDEATEDRLPPLPPPSELGCGNPFLMFLCLSTLILQRGQVMSTCHDYNDIAMYYDKMVRQHRIENVVHYARQLYAAYLKELQRQQKNDEDDADDNSSAVTNRM